ncbi:MAG: hypothetical protein ABI614_21070 [Planctomycetota bacterium]
MAPPFNCLDLAFLIVISGLLFEASALNKSFFLFLFCVLLAIGCGESGPPVVPVTGTLTLNGAPLPFKSLTFFPAEGTGGQGAGGYSNGAGEYYLNAVVPNATRDFRGCPPGKYRVVVSEPLIPMTEADFTNPTLDTSGGSEPAPAAFLPDDRGLKRKPKPGEIPAIYTSDETSPLLIDVAEGSETINFALVSGKQ